MKDICERLGERRDDLSTGYPATQSEVEIRILQRLFTEEEAEFFLKLSPLPEAPEQVAARLGCEPEGTAALMERMAGKGLLFRLRKGDTVRYGALPFLVGILELSLNPPPLVEDLDRFYRSGGQIFSWDTQGQSQFLHSKAPERVFSATYPRPARGRGSAFSTGSSCGFPH